MKNKFIILLVSILFVGAKAYSQEQPYNALYQLCYSGSGSHLMNLYVARLLNTDVTIIRKDKVLAYDKFNHLFHLTNNPRAPKYYRTHFSQKVPKDEKSFLLLLLRDYKECFFHEIINGMLKGSISQEFSKFPKNMNSYFENIHFFDEWEGDKLILYYEDFLFDPLPELQKLHNELGLNVKDLPALILRAKEESRNIFKLYPGRAHSRGKSTDYHMKSRSKEVAYQMNKKVKEHYPDLFDQYLFRYSE